jgi:hypothetical protein
MIHLDDEENIEVFSSPCSAPPIEPIIDEPLLSEPVSAPPAEVANENQDAANENETAGENIVQLPAPQIDTLETQTRQKSFEKQAEDSFRMALGSNAKAVEGLYSSAGDAMETVTNTMRTSAEEWMTGFNKLNAKLFEFGRLNAQSSMDFMRAIAGVRSVRDAVDVQTAYLRGQYDAMTTQLRELQTLTTEVAGKTAQPFSDQFVRSTQLGRMC